MNSYLGANWELWIHRFWLSGFTQKFYEIIFSAFGAEWLSDDNLSTKLIEVKKWIQCFQLVPAGADRKPWIHVTQYKP